MSVVNKVVTNQLISYDLFDFDRFDLQVCRKCKQLRLLNFQFLCLDCQVEVNRWN